MSKMEGGNPLEVRDESSSGISLRQAFRKSSWEKQTKETSRGRNFPEKRSKGHKPIRNGDRARPTRQGREERRRIKGGGCGKGGWGEGGGVGGGRGGGKETGKRKYVGSEVRGGEWGRGEYVKGGVVRGRGGRGGIEEDRRVGGVRIRGGVGERIGGQGDMCE